MARTASDDDRQFLKDTKTYLRNIPDVQPLTWHVHARNLLRPLLDRVQEPILSVSSQTADEVCQKNIDAFELDSDTARRLIEAAEAVPIPVFASDGHVPFHGLETTPIEILLDRFPSDQERLEVQIVSDLKNGDPRILHTVAEIRKRFRATQSKPDPWNILGFESPFADSILPSWLAGRNAGLLLDIARFISSNITACISDGVLNNVNNWRHMTSWVLLAEAGALTTPHQDALGFGTWFTCLQGEMGFAWLSRPNDDELAAWSKDPVGYHGGRWCYKVLRPGTTVYFDPGLVHCVFRRDGDERQTMAVGGHVLRRSAVGSWLKIMRQQLIGVRARYPTPADRPPLPFNEDVERVLGIAPALLHTARSLVDEDNFECNAIERRRFMNNHHGCLRLLETIKASEHNEEAPEEVLEEEEQDEDELGEEARDDDLDEDEEDESPIGTRERRMRSLPRRQSTESSPSSSSGVDDRQSPTADERSATGAVVAVNPESPFVDDEDYARRLQGLGSRARRQSQRHQPYRNWRQVDGLEDS
ncbi:hypothetical protein LTR86_008832 [Recurvomyces mirabilis]|nr:hypothetical protein LTR86_008832 [Recurvomyces mirabilis]